MSFTIALDAMGGDHGPNVVVPAALSILKEVKDLNLILVGDHERLVQELKNHGADVSPRLQLKHASQQVEMDELPSAALRGKKDSSMRVAINLVREGVASACVSAGNTGALMATSRFVLKTLPGIDRPAIISALPTTKGHTHMLDLGANVDSSADELFQFAVMGSVLVQAVEGTQRPTVGLLNIGEEEIKGNERVKEAARMLANSDINYVGYVEGNDIFKGAVDVVVCDGFVGNVALKTTDNVTAILLTGTDTGDFALDTTGCAGTAPVITTGSSCTVTVTFSPASVGAKLANLQIDSDDPDSPMVNVALSGTGVVPQPDIAVSGPVAFADTTEGTTNPSPATVTITNNGAIDLNVSAIQLTGTDTGDFALDTTGCGGTTPVVASGGGNCSVTVTFSPASAGAKSASVQIDSDDLDSPIVNVALSGTALSSIVNNVPTTPDLVFPTPGQSGLGTTIDFEWEKSTDPDGDNVTYSIKICENESLTEGCIEEINIASLKGNLYLTGTGIGLLLFGTVFAGGIRSKKFMSLLLSLIVVAMLSVSCGSGDGDDDDDDIVTQTVSGLEEETTYYWKVVSDDGKGGVTESEVRSFRTR